MDGRAVWMCTSAASVTARNVREEPRVCLALPDTFAWCFSRGRRSVSRTGRCRTQRRRSPTSSGGTLAWKRVPFCMYAWSRGLCALGAASRNYAAESSCVTGCGWMTTVPRRRASVGITVDRCGGPLEDFLMAERADRSAGRDQGAVNRVGKRGASQGLRPQARTCPCPMARQGLRRPAR
ncbi:hypothetical protein [Streptomyces phaeofaciens]